MQLISLIVIGFNVWLDASKNKRKGHSTEDFYANICFVYTDGQMDNLKYKHYDQY